MKLTNTILIALVAAALVGCVEWHNSGPSPGQTSLPAWNQVQVGMTRQQVYALMGKPLRETEQVAAWRGPEVRRAGLQTILPQPIGASMKPTLTRMVM